MSRPMTLTPGGPKSTIRSTGHSAEPAHLPLHRRLLFPTLPADQPLPVLVEPTSRDLVLLNERLYHLIALALRAYILSWLPRVSRDRSLLPHIHATLVVPILAPILLEIATNPDSLIDLILLDIPANLTSHIKTYWASRTVHVLHQSPEPLDQIYHYNDPLLACVPAESTTEPIESTRIPVEETQYVVSDRGVTTLADTLIRNSISGDDYRSLLQRTMAREVLGRAVIGSITKRLAQPWFWYGLLLKFLPPISVRAKKARIGWPESVWRWMSRLWVIVWTMWDLGIWVMATLASVPRTSRTNGVTACWVELTGEMLSVGGRFGRRNWIMGVIWTLIDGTAWIMAPFLDRLVPCLLRMYALTPQTALRVIDMLEQILFPLEGYPAPTPPDPTEDEVLAMRKEVEERLEQLIPVTLRHLIAPEPLGTGLWLEPMSDPGCNAHLVVRLVSCVVGCLNPSLLTTQAPVTSATKA